MLPLGPRHENERDFAADRVGYNIVLAGMNPLRTNAEPKLGWNTLAMKLPKGLVMAGSTSRNAAILTHPIKVMVRTFPGARGCATEGPVHP